MKRTAALLPLMVLSCAAVTPPAAPPSQHELAPLFSRNQCASHALMTGRASITVGEDRMAARATLLVSRPARLRLTLADPLGSVWFLATANEESLFYASPAQGTSEMLARQRGSSIRLGGERYWAEDLIDNLPPCLDPALLRDGDVRFSDGALVLERDGVRRRWEFYPGGRIRSLSLLRPSASPIRFEFTYPDEGKSFRVSINRAADFSFTSVTEVDAPPDASFKPPEDR